MEERVQAVVERPSLLSQCLVSGGQVGLCPHAGPGQRDPNQCPQTHLWYLIQFCPCIQVPPPVLNSQAFHTPPSHCHPKLLPLPQPGASLSWRQPPHRDPWLSGPLAGTRRVPWNPPLLLFFRLPQASTPVSCQPHPSTIPPTPQYYAQQASLLLTEVD